MEVKNYDGIWMGRNYDGIIRRVWTFDVARAYRIFSLGKLVLLERVNEEKIRCSPPTLALRLFTTIRRRRKERVSGGFKKHYVS